MRTDESKLDEILAKYDARTEPFNEIDLADEIRDLVRQRGKGIEPTFRELAEETAFGFAATDSDEPSRWGTYYGPMGSATMKSGETIEFPSIERITPEMLSYWAKRIREAKHPQVMARYADVVFDFSERVTGKKPDYRLAHVVIDETLKIPTQGARVHEPETQTRLNRSLDLAILINDEIRMGRVRDGIVAFERMTAEDGELGTWGFAYDVLIDGRHRCPLSEQQEESIITDLEQRLVRVVSSDPQCFDPFAAESAAMRLAKYYRRKERPEDVRRVLRMYKGAWLKFSREAMPPLGATWLQKVHDVLVDFDLKDDANSLEVQLRELGNSAHENMVTIRHSVQFAKEEIDQFINDMTAGTLRETLTRIAFQFLPDPEQVRNQVLKIAGEFPLQSFLTSRFMDTDGRVIAEVGSVRDDLDGHIVRRMAEDMDWWSFFLRAVVESSREKFEVSCGAILDFLFHSPAFLADRRHLIGKGIDAYLSGDFDVAVHMLIPQIEAAVRNLVAIAGGLLYTQGRHGGTFLRNLDRLLQDKHLRSALSERIALYFRILLTDQRGWNLRNVVCHGMARADSFGSRVADRVFHAVLLLGLVREQQADVDHDGPCHNE